MEVSGLKFLSEEARAKALEKKANKFEGIKAAKCGSKMWTEVHELSALLKEGKTTFEDLDLDDVEVRLKWAGLFHRKKRTPGKFMMRLKVRAPSPPAPRRSQANVGVLPCPCRNVHAFTNMGTLRCAQASTRSKLERPTKQPADSGSQLPFASRLQNQRGPSSVDDGIDLTAHLA